MPDDWRGWVVSVLTLLLLLAQLRGCCPLWAPRRERSRLPRWSIGSVSDRVTLQADQPFDRPDEGRPFTWNTP